MAWILRCFTNRWFHSAVSKIVITWPQVCWLQADHKICNVEHGTSEFQPAIITYPKIMPSPELKYRLILVINIILRENSGKVVIWGHEMRWLVKIHSAKIECCRAWVNKFSSYGEQTCDHAIIFFKPRSETNGPWSDTKFKPFERTSRST